MNSRADFDLSMPLVTCLPGEINQVILNMIVNSAHAISEAQAGDTGKKGAITVSTKHLGDFAQIRITDTGAGIPENFRSRIFDPFFTTKEVGKGTGQGLSIALPTLHRDGGQRFAFAHPTRSGKCLVSLRSTQPTCYTLQAYHNGGQPARPPPRFGPAIPYFLG